MLLAHNGHTIFALSRNATALTALQEESVQQGHPGKIIPIGVDITSETGITQAVQQISTLTNHLDALINNAGQLVNKPFFQLTPADWNAMYSTHVFGPVALIKGLLPALTRDASLPKSHIVNISSMGGVQGSTKFSGLSAYSSSKGALCTLTECLAEEFQPLGIAVNALAIGSVETEMFRTAFPNFKAATNPDTMAKFMADFILNGPALFNGKVLPVSNSTP